MFRALNSLISKLDAEPAQPGSRVGGGHNANNLDGSFGFQVLRNSNSEVPIEPWFDFVVGINGRVIDSPDPNLFATEVRNCAGGSVSLDVWSAKGQRTHTLTIPLPHSSPSLGLTLQLAPLSITQNIWHILNIPSPLSPAHTAGLLPHSDYIVGTPSGTLRGEAALGELIEDHLNRNLVLWVYNSEFDVVREVEIIPRRGWGGEGALGAELGYGALHRLPIPLSEEVQAPGESLFEAANGSNRPSFDNTNSDQFRFQQQQPPHYLLPATLQPPPPMVSPTAPPTTTTSSSTSHGRPPRKSRHNPHNPSPSKEKTLTFDAYFEESVQKSQKEDFAPSPRKGTPVAPPPKVTAPPRPRRVGSEHHDHEEKSGLEHGDEDREGAGDGGPGPAEQT